MMNKNTIRGLRGTMNNDDLLQIAALLIKAGYTVRIVTVTKPNAKTKEKVVEYWEGTDA